MAIPPLVLRIYADSSGVKKGVAQAQTQVSGLRASVASNAGLIKTALVGGVAAGLVVATNAAADLGEAQNKANVIFGKSVAPVAKFADEAATGFGIAKAEAFEAAASFGAMFDSAGLAESAAAKMSVTMTGLAGDMASFNNTDPSEMLEKLRSGLSGEAEPLRRYGVFISEARVQTEAYASGIAKAGQELTDAQKIQARFNIILKDTKKQAGDFARTSGSLPNQLRVLRAQAINLAASFGKILLPAVTLLVKGLNLVLKPLAAIVEVMNGTAPAVDVFKNALEDSGLTAEQAGTRIDRVYNEALKRNAGDVRGAMNEVRTFTAELKQNERINAAAASRWAAGAAQAAAMGNKVEGVTGKVRRFTQLTREQFNEWADKAKEQFDGVGAALDNLAGKTKLTADKIINQFSRQARNLRDYRENLEDVAGRNIPDRILQQLIDMGMGGADILAVLAAAGDKKFAQIIGAMKRTDSQTQRTRNEIEQLKGSLRTIPTNVATTIRLNIETLLDVQGGPLRAGGGPVQGGHLYRINERGQEWFVPHTSGQIIPAGGTQGGDGASLPDVVVYVGDTKMDEVVVKALNKAGRR